eukprot:TRINITY_DN1885_c0_g2_i1.p2 TRINITY_DN1885_c0_g2~~TRINITY_DN1885_c0_g2_i1.p2  ORF type:complete len:151 (-),score=4.28 TRINITY_DN1885_c0_g2_i1:364-816(-)
MKEQKQLELHQRKTVHLRSYISVVFSIIQFIGYNLITCEGTRAIGDALAKNKVVIGLDLGILQPQMAAYNFVGGNKVGNEGARAIEGALKKNHVLAELGLSIFAPHKFIGHANIGNEEAKLIGAALKENSALVKLDLGIICYSNMVYRVQ